jgi:hypothetical protein
MSMSERMVAAALPAAVAACLGLPAPTAAEIISVSYQQAETMDLTRVGSVDWCVYRVADVAGPSLTAADFKKGGSGIARKIAVRGRVQKVEDTQWTGVGWGWTDGTKLASHSHRQGDQDHMGIRAWIDAGGAMVFEFAAQQAAKLGEIDYLKAAVDFAECMIRHGRDRYGKVHSPLFAVLLTRQAEPSIGPHPYFDRPTPYDVSNMNTPFRKYNFNRCLNYPGGLGGEGPHKVTVFGCDVYEDRDLYETLFDLSRISGQARYRAEAEKALRWWFTNTMGPAGLYPWGEHLGWDFDYECPTYFQGPSRQLYAACYHEIKDQVPFLDILAAIPAPKAGEATYLERYALGVWSAHYWDPQRAIYCRHGDYTGQDKRTGSYEGFPAHQGAHLRLWAAAYLHARNAEVKAKMEHILHKVLDVQIARARKFGFVPFTFEPDYKGKDPGKTAPGQSLRLAHHAAELSVRMRGANGTIAAKLQELARLHLGEQKLPQAMENLRMYRATGDSAYLQAERDAGEKPDAQVADLSKADTPDPHAREIIRRLQWYRMYKDPAYLAAAEQQARLAYVQFLDAACPLPKAYSGPPRKTVEGKPFPDFYFRGAKLMHAFALLGEAKRGGRGASSANAAASR